MDENASMGINRGYVRYLNIKKLKTMYIINSFVGQLLLSFLFFKVIIVHYHLTPKAKENKI